MVRKFFGLVIDSNKSTVTGAGKGAKRSMEDVKKLKRSMCAKSQSSQVEHLRSLTFDELLSEVLEMIEFFAVEDCEKNEVRCLAMMIAEVIKLPPDAAVKIAGSNIPAEMVSEIYMQIRNEHIQHVIGNYHQATYYIKHTKTYLRTALYNSVFEIDLRIENQIRTDMPELFKKDRRV